MLNTRCAKSGENKESCRERWIDRIKLFACVLVALGHFFQSMVEAELLSATEIYAWFNDTIYYFHVPLFFVCSGYLYQKTGEASLSAWKRNVVKKLITLGIPYFVFSSVTWILKVIFSDAVNSQNEGFLRTLFLQPASPYWYLYTLFFIFAVTPVFQNRKKAVQWFLAALALKLVNIAFNDAIDVYAVSAVTANEIWFVCGMVLCQQDVPSRLSQQCNRRIGGICTILFVICSGCISLFSIKADILPTVMGCWGCLATILVACVMESKVFWIDQFGQYTMPVYLMHTIFAAGLRTVLLKIGIMNSVVHIVLGIAVSFVGPIVAIEIMKRMKLDIFVYPGNYIKIPKDFGEKNHV